MFQPRRSFVAGLAGALALLLAPRLPRAQSVYAYDAQGRLKTVTHADGTVTTYT